MKKALKESFSYVIQGVRGVRHKSINRKGYLVQYGVHYEFTAKNDEEAKKIWKEYTQPTGNQSDKIQICYDTQLFKLTVTQLA